MSESAENSEKATKPTITKPSGIKPPTQLQASTQGACSRISRPCSGHHAAKAGPPPPDAKSVSTSSDGYWEATGRRNSSDHGADLTIDTDSFIIGERIYVGGVRPGRITFIGETHFAPGEWAGVVLDDAEGKNDGCVAGKRYFQCEPKKGIFSRLGRLSREQLSHPSTPDGSSSMDQSYRLSSRSGTTSPSQSITNFASRTPKTSKVSNLHIGDRVIVSSAFGSRPGVLKFVGEVKFATGTWCGIHLDEVSGKNDGIVEGERYFTCPPNCGIMVPVAKVSLSPSSSSRKPRLSRANSQESLSSNITMGSIASTTTSKLRMNANHQRISSAKSPNAMSTPKPSFSLQDVLREKTNHIEHLMKERETDREEMSSQTQLFQKNISQVSTMRLKDKIGILETLLDEEKKRSEDLQFSVEEAKISSEEQNTSVQGLKKNLENLENELIMKNKIMTVNNLQASGDFVSGNAIATDSTSELEETKKKLQITEELKKSLENQIQSLNNKLKESENNMEIHMSSIKVSEEVQKDEVNYLEKRVQDLELELTERSAEIEKQKTSLKQMEIKMTENAAVLENQIKEVTTKESSTMVSITTKDSEIEKLKKDIEMLSNSEKSIKEVLRTKESELIAMKQEFSAKTLDIENMLKESQTRAEDISTKQLSMEELSKSLSVTQIELKNTLQLQEEQKENLKVKSEAFEGQKIQLSELSEEIINLKNKLLESDKLIAVAGESINKTRESEAELVEKLAKLEEQKNQMDTVLKTKDIQLLDAITMTGKLQTELEIMKTALTNLEVEVNEKESTVNEKDANVTEMKEKMESSQDRLRQLQEVHDFAIKSHEEKLTAAQKSMEESMDLVKKEILREVDDLKSKNNALKQLEAEKDAQAEKLTQKLKANLAENEELQSQLSTKNDEMTELINKLSKAGKDASEKNSQWEKTSKSLDDTQKRLEAAEERIKKQQEECSKTLLEKSDLNRQLEQVEDKFTKLVEQKDKLQQELEQIRNSSIDSNSEATRLNEKLKESCKALDSLREISDKNDLQYKSSVDMAALQNSNLNEQLHQLRTEMTNLSEQKIDSENILNLELANIKTISEEEKKRLQLEIQQMQKRFQEEQRIMRKDNKTAEETFEKIKGELDTNIRNLEVDIENKVKEQEEKNAMFKNKEDSLKTVISELKNDHEQLQVELNSEHQNVTHLKQTLDTLSLSKLEQKSQYEKKMMIKENQITKLQEQLNALTETQKMGEDDTEEKIRNLNEISQRVYEYEQENAKLKTILNNDKTKQSELEATSNEWIQKHHDLEEEQVDLVNRKEEYKNQCLMLSQQIQQMETARTNFDGQILLERKESEEFKITSEMKIKDLMDSLQQIQNSYSLKDQESEELIKKFQLRDDEISQHKLAFSEMEMLKTTNDENNRMMIKEKEDKLNVMRADSTTKDNLIADLQNNLANLQVCLKTVNLDKASSSQELLELQKTISMRDVSLEEMKKRIAELDSQFHERENRLSNVESSRMKLESDSQMAINELQEQIGLLEEVKHKEVSELAAKLEKVETRMLSFGSEAESSSSNLKQIQKHEVELMRKIKDLEISETELMITNSTLKKEVEQLKLITNIPKPVEGMDDDESRDQIAFLNSIIADMHKKNLKLTKQVASLETLPGDISQNGMNFDFLNKKKQPAPRMYCDICEIFDAHETEDCPIQCSDADSVGPTPRDPTKERILPPSRKYCESCEMFDHEIGECPDEEY
ncbi:unnamed protein product [Diamesa serratosioi]